MLDEDAKVKRATGSLRVFDVKNPAVREALRDAPKIGESLCAECKAHFADVRRYLDAYGVEYTLEPTLVRGLDYYTRTVFEFVGVEEKAQSAICSGGRYDGLVAEIGGPPTPGIGFGAGIERALLALENEGVAAHPQSIDVFFVNDGAPREQILVTMAELRRSGVSCDTDYASRSLKGQLTQAGRTGAHTVVIADADGATVRRAGEAEVRVALAELAATLIP